jgi:hypothetical protein
MAWRVWVQSESEEEARLEAKVEECGTRQNARASKTKYRREEQSE